MADDRGAALREYHRKRRFSRTPEPRGEVVPERRDGDRVFVVQKHAASRLHYDFRLELEGVLKSWAVPKGPSLDPADKRLAMHVEDHPLEYGSFEGIIPKGEYGGGTVLLWDRGTWRPEGDPHRAYRAGNLKFTLEGEKLRGGWALVRIRDRRQARDAERSWLLIKHGDAAAQPAARYSVVEKRPDSVATGRTMDEIAAARDRVWHSNRGGDGKPASVSAAPAAAGKRDVPGARRAALPRFVPPQLATLVSEAPSGEAWLHEMKFDGYRILARLDNGRVTLLSRNGREWTEQFPTVVQSLRELPARAALLDGEVAVVTEDGRTSFQALQNYMSGSARDGLVYMAFDLLHRDDQDLTGARLEDRKAALAALLGPRGREPGVLRYSDHVVGSGAEFFAEACRIGLEGAVSKRRDAPYRSGRNGDWLKTKCLKRQEVVIGGFTDPEGSRLGIGALLAGVYEDGRLVYVGKVGTGFTDATLRMLRDRLKPLERSTSPFAARVTGVVRPHWVEPRLVAEVAFGEWTADGRMRHPSFQGLREDKPASEVVREEPAATPAGNPTPADPAPTARGARKRPRAAPSRPARTRGGARKPAPAGRARTATGDPVVAGVRLTHADRVLYPPQGITKLDLARFYESIAEWILPHLVDRPTTLVRCPEGVHRPCFYQKHTGYWTPDTVRRVPIKEKTKTGEYLVVDDLPALIGLVQIGILEIHTWSSTVSDLERPDRLVFDLDPGPGVAWARVIEAARTVRSHLQAQGLEGFVKTTGGKGLHVVAPLVPQAGWEEVGAFARRVAEAIVREEPARYLARMARAERKGKIFIDYLRNVHGATSVAAYSTRAKPTAPISVPLEWDELSARRPSDYYTIATLPRRLAGLRADPWRGYASRRRPLPAPPRPGRTR